MFFLYPLRATFKRPRATCGTRLNTAALDNHQTRYQNVVPFVAVIPFLLQKFHRFAPLTKENSIF